MKRARRVWRMREHHIIGAKRPEIPHSSFRIPNFSTSSTASGPPVSPVGSVGASACGRGLALRNIVVSLACSASRYSLFLHLTAFVVTSFISFAPAFVKLGKRALNHSAAPPLPKQSATARGPRIATGRASAVRPPDTRAPQGEGIGILHYHNPEHACVRPSITNL